MSIALTEDDRFVFEQAPFDGLPVNGRIVFGLAVLGELRLVDAQWLDARELLEAEGHLANLAFLAAKFPRLRSLVNVRVAGMNENLGVRILVENPLLEVPGLAFFAGVLAGDQVVGAVRTRLRQTRTARPGSRA